MDRSRLRVLGPGLLWLALAGCASQPTTITLPPPPPDEWRLPPENDPRFSQPPSYPRDVLNQGPTKKNYSSGGPGGGPGGAGGGPRFGGGASTSAGGPMGGPTGGSLSTGGF